MNITQDQIDLVTFEWMKADIEGLKYFENVSEALATAVEKDPSIKYGYSTPFRIVSEADRKVTIPNLSDRLASLVKQIIEMSKSSPLISDSDRTDLRNALRSMLAALNLRHYKFWDTHSISDEDRVLGIKEAGHGEPECTLADARQDFIVASNGVRKILRLIFPSETPIATALVRSEGPEAIKKSRRNTAFIMMWISPDHPELDDVKTCFKEVFKRFGIEAVRSDEIEHSGVITERILDEIATSEFLIADLTGERPSVYYEVGYAHAMGKRPILYRKAGTKLHFDLSVHNCPEYQNITDLRQKLEARLSILTNKAS